MKIYNVKWLSLTIKLSLDMLCIRYEAYIYSNISLQRYKLQGRQSTVYKHKVQSTETKECLYSYMYYYIYGYT